MEYRYKSRLTENNQEELKEINELMAKYDEFRDKDNHKRFAYLEEALDLGLSPTKELREDVWSNNAKAKKIIYKLKRNDEELFPEGDNEYEISASINARLFRDLKESLIDSIKNGEWTEDELLEEAHRYVSFSEKKSVEEEFWLVALKNMENDLGLPDMVHDFCYEKNAELYGTEPMWMLKYNYNFQDSPYEWRTFDLGMPSGQAAFLMRKSDFEIIEFDDNYFDLIKVKNQEKNIDGFFIGDIFHEEGRDDFEGIYLDKQTRMVEKIYSEDEIHSIEDLEGFAIGASERLREEWREHNRDKEKDELNNGINEVEKTEDYNSEIKYYNEKKEFDGIEFIDYSFDVLSTKTKTTHSNKDKDFVFEDQTLKIVRNRDNHDIQLCIKRGDDTIGYFLGSKGEDEKVEGFFIEEWGKVEVSYWNKCNFSEIKKFCINAYETGRNIHFRSYVPQYNDYEVREIQEEDYRKEKLIDILELPEQHDDNIPSFSSIGTNSVILNHTLNFGKEYEYHSSILFDSSDMGIIHKPDDVMCYTLKDGEVSLGAFFGRKNKENDMIDGFFVTTEKDFLSNKNLHKKLFSMEDIKEFSNEAYETIQQSLVYNRLKEQGASLEEINKELFGIEPAYVVSKKEWCGFSIEELTSQDFPDCVVRASDLKFLRNASGLDEAIVASYIQEELYTEKYNYSIDNLEEKAKTSPDEKVLTLGRGISYWGGEYSYYDASFDTTYKRLDGKEYTVIRKSDFEILEKKPKIIVEKVVDENGNTNLFTAGYRDSNNVRPCYYYDSGTDRFFEIGNFTITSEEKMKEIVQIAQEKCQEKSERDREEDLEL